MGAPAYTAVLGELDICAMLCGVQNEKSKDMIIFDFFENEPCSEGVCARLTRVSSQNSVISHVMLVICVIKNVLR